MLCTVTGKDDGAVNQGIDTTITGSFTPIQTATYALGVGEKTATAIDPINIIHLPEINIKGKHKDILR